jgi:hypothetical protein
MNEATYTDQIPASQLRLVPVMKRYDNATASYFVWCPPEPGEPIVR